MIRVGLERIIAEGRVWLENGYLKLKEITSSISNLSPDDDHIHIYVKDKSGTATPYWKDDADTEHEFAGTSIVPPIDADYLVKTSNATLTAERVVTDTTSITVDWATAGQAKFQRAALTGDVTASLNDNATTIANNAVTNAKLNDMAAWTVKARNNSGSGDPQDVALADLTEEASPAAGDFLFGFLDTGELRKFDIDNLPSSESSSGGDSGGHLHGMMRVVGDGATATFNLLDYAEYIEHVGVGGSFQDPATFTLAATRDQIIFDAAPSDDAVITIEYVMAGI
jgi:hypothetical protein